MSTDFRTCVRNCDTNSQADSDGKFAWVQYQLRQAALGLIDCIACPYCGSNVVLGLEKLCCESINEATGIVLDSMEVGEDGGHTVSVQ
jgi:hypothetical protein